MANSNIKNTPRLTDPSLLLAAGFNPKTGLPLKFGEKSSTAKENIRRILRIQDEQDAVNRFTWYNLPDITGQELERLIYYKGQICMFYNETLGKFLYLPYALDGSIDVYGRYTAVHPVPMGSTELKDDDAKNKQLGNWLSTIHLEVLYDLPDFQSIASIDDMGNLQFNFDYKNLSTKTALLHDYTPQLSQTITSRQVLNDVILDVESDCIPFMRTALLNATGVRGIRVADASEAPGVWQASASMNEAALAGQKYIPIAGALDFQDLADGAPARAEEFLLAMQSLDNIRLGTYGLENGGIFQKKAHELQAEAAMAGGNTNLVIQDSLARRQRWCNIINSLTGLGIWCEISETASGLDKNFDGEVSDEQDGQEQPIEGGQMNV